MVNILHFQELAVQELTVQELAVQNRTVQKPSGSRRRIFSKVL